mgnify:CR=1 FL=1
MDEGEENKERGNEDFYWFGPVFFVFILVVMILLYILGPKIIKFLRNLKTKHKIAPKP